MKNIKVKKIIFTAFAIFYFFAMNTCLYYGYQNVVSYISFNIENIGLVITFAILSSIFYFIIIHLYGDTEKFKIKAFVISVISFLLSVVYAIVLDESHQVYGTLSYYSGEQTTIAVMLIVYLFVWQKLNWLDKMKHKLINPNHNIISQKKKNKLLSIFNFLTENPLIIIFVFLQIVATLDIFNSKYTFEYWIEYYEKKLFLFVFVLCIESLIQLVIVLGLNIFFKNKKSKYIVIVLSLALMIFVPRVLEYDFLNCHFDINDFKNQIIKSIEEKKAASEHKKEIENELKNGPKRFLEQFQIANDIHSANVGQVVKFGKTFVKNDISNKEDAYYYVLKKDANILTLMSLYCIDYVDNDFIYKNGNKGYYDYFDNEYYKNAFTDDEKKMIVDTIAQDNSKHKVYVPNTNDLLKMIAVNNNVNVGVVNSTLMKEIIKHRVVFNDFYFRGECEYLLESNILKPNTIRTRLYSADKCDKIRDYDEKKNLDYHGDMEIFIRTKISVDASN